MNSQIVEDDIAKYERMQKEWTEKISEYGTKARSSFGSHQEAFERRYFNAINKVRVIRNVLDSLYELREEMK